MSRTDERLKMQTNSTNAKFMRLLESRRWCYVIPSDAFVEGFGFRVSVAVEKEKGHFPTGNLDTISTDKKIRNKAFAEGATVPWFWGMTYNEAEKVCEASNERLGYSKLEAAQIVASTMGG